MKFTLQTHFDSLEEMNAHLAQLPSPHPATSVQAATPAAAPVPPPQTAPTPPPGQPAQPAPVQTVQPGQPAPAGQLPPMHLPPSPGMQQMHHGQVYPAQPQQAPQQQAPQQQAPQQQGAGGIAEIEALARELVASNKMPALLQIRDEFGLSKVTDCPPERQPEMLAKLQALRG